MSTSTNQPQPDLTRLRPEEREALPIIIRLLSRRKGRKQAMPNRVFRLLLSRRYNIELKDAGFRKLVHKLRAGGVLPGLVACSRGYYITTNPGDIDRWVKSVESRIAAMLETVARAQEYKSTLIAKSPNT